MILSIEKGSLGTILMEKMFRRGHCLEQRSLPRGWFGLVGESLNLATFLSSCSGYPNLNVGVEEAKWPQLPGYLWA